MFTPHGIATFHAMMVRFLVTKLERKFDGVTIVVRHHTQCLSKLERGEVVPSTPILQRMAGVLGVDLADLKRTGYDRSAIATSTTAGELNHLGGQLTESQKELALELLKAVARHRRG